MGVKCPLPVEREGDKFFPASANDFLLKNLFEFSTSTGFFTKHPIILLAYKWIRKILSARVTSKEVNYGGINAAVAKFFMSQFSRVKWDRKKVSAGAECAYFLLMFRKQ
jgi:hypothetical protein